MAGTPAPAGTTTVLVIDDDPDIGLVLSSLFRRIGVRTVVARDGRDALGLVAEVAPQLVVLDLGLPDVDGLDLLPKLREMTDASVLLLSARAHDDDRAAGLRRGADDYVTKPFTNADLLGRCLALLGRGQVTSGRGGMPA